MSIFEQVIDEISTSLERLFKKNPDEKRLFEFLLVPERIISFKVPWQDRNGKLQWNTGWRIQFNSALGPGKGGLRLFSNLTEDVLLALSIEQTFKNALTGFNIGGSKGGSNFSPVNKTENEIRNFCQAFMQQLYKYIGENSDIPAGDAGCGAKEVGYLYGEYRKITGQFVSSMTGKGLIFGGSELRPESTGFGVVYFLENMLDYKNDTLEGKNVIVTGAGNVAMFAMEKLIEKRAKIVAINDVSGCLIFDKHGMKDFHLDGVKYLYDHRKTLKDLTFDDCKFYPSDVCIKPWFLEDVKADIIFPCAIQNEIDESDAKKLVENGLKYISEGSNMSSTKEAIKYFIENDVFYGPSKAANCGGVGCSAIEMAQNASKNYLNRQEVDIKLKQLMKNVFETCLKVGKQYLEEGESENESLLIGSNIAGFLRISQAMREQGYYY